MIVGSCCVCHQAIGTMFHTYYEGTGFFLVGKEPRTCEGACTDRLTLMSSAERRSFFILSGFEFQDEPPTRSTNPLDDIAARDSDMRVRARRLVEAEKAERRRLVGEPA